MYMYPNTVLYISIFRSIQEASTFDVSQQLQYLDMVMDESTRVHTPTPRSVAVVYCPNKWKLPGLMTAKCRSKY